MQIRNISPYGHLDVPLLRRVVEARETVDVTVEQAARLLVQTDNFAPADTDAEQVAATVLAALEQWHADNPVGVLDPGQVSPSAAGDASPELGAPGAAPPDDGPPPHNASTEVWRTYAVQSRGADANVVAELGRGKLIELFGGDQS